MKIYNLPYWNNKGEILGPLRTGEVTLGDCGACVSSPLFNMQLKKMPAYVGREIIRIKSRKSKMRKPWLGFFFMFVPHFAKQNEVIK